MNANDLSLCADSGTGCLELLLHFTKQAGANSTSADLGRYHLFHVLTGGANFGELLHELTPPFGEEAVKWNGNMILFPDGHKLAGAHERDAQSMEVCWRKVPRFDCFSNLGVAHTVVSFELLSFVRGLLLAPRRHWLCCS